MELLKPQQTLDEGLVVSDLGDDQNPCYNVAASAEKFTEPGLSSLGSAQNHCDQVAVEVPKLTNVELLLGQMQNRCDGISVRDPEFAEKCNGSALHSLGETRNIHDALLVGVPDFSVSVEELAGQESASLGQMQNHYDEIPVKDPDFGVSAEKCSGPKSASLDERQNNCDAFTTKGPELSVSVEKGEQMSLSAGSVEEHACDVGYESKVELPRNGISLFVELNNNVRNGGSNDLGKCVLPDNSLSNGSLLQDDGHFSAKIENKERGDSVKNEECRVNVCNLVWAKSEEYRFNVGNLVWAKNKTLWLPGIICDPLDAPKEARETETTNCLLLVKCFGNANFVWCLPSQLRPFLEFFEQMSKQSFSKGFIGALEEAKAEIGRRVKMEMTCPCFSNGVDERGKFDEHSVTQFEPASFVARIKSLAQDVSGHSRLECTLIQNQISAFYKSIGHYQIPLHQLKPVNEGSTPENKDGELTKLCEEDSNIGKKKRSSKSVETFNLENGERSSDGKSGRERRKSRYLSYPYIDIKAGRKGCEEDRAEDTKEVSPDGLEKKNIQAVGSPSSVKTDGKKSKRKTPRKGTTRNDASRKAVKINPSSAEVLSELQHVAIDCLYPTTSKLFDAAENSILKYRKMVFQDYRTAEQETLPEVQVHSDKGMPDSIGVGGQDQVQQSLLNVLPKKRRRQKKDKLSDSKTSPTPILPVAGVSIKKELLSFNEMMGNDLVRQPLMNSASEERGRKMEKLESRPLPILPYPTNGPVMLEFQKLAPVGAVANVGLQQIEVMPSNGKTTILNFEDSRVIGPPFGKLQPKRRNKMEGSTSNLAKFDSVLQEVQQIDVMPLNGDTAIFNYKDTQVTGPPLGKLQPKRRKEKEGDASNQAKLDTVLQEVQVMGPSMVQTIPGLNNSMAINQPASFQINFEAHTAGQSQMGIHTPASVEELMKRKRGRKRKEKASEFQNNGALPIPDLNGIESGSKPQNKRRKRIIKAEACIDYSKLQNNGEISGPALILKFAAGEPVPSKEALVSAFSGFGPLKELETRPLDNSDIAQVVFEISSNALAAFRSLEKNSPFGPSLVNFQLHNFSGEASQGSEGSKSMSPIGKLSARKPEQKVAKDLPGIRKNLEMMTSMLKKCGASLSPEMRAKLESEVNGLLEKVSDMVDN